MQDKSCSAKKIIFDDSDESEEVEIIEKVTLAPYTHTY